MQINHQVISNSRRIYRWSRLAVTTRILLSSALLFAALPLPCISFAQNTQTPSSTTQQTPANPSSTPAGTQTPQQQQPGVRPTQTQPPISSGTTPGSTIGAVPGASPAQLPADPPPISPNFKAPDRPLPPSDRVGVDVSNQVPLSLNQAIAMALQNNNDIDASRIDVKIAEFNLQSSRGVYDPVFSTESFYERKTTPTSSTVAGGINGSLTQSDPTADLRLGGFSPFLGGSYQADFSSTRLMSTNQTALLNPQYPSAFTFTYTQPLWRGLRFDLLRHNIEIAKKNLSLSDLQFRQKAIDVISRVQQSYWDLVFALRNLQVQIDAVKQARTQVESNQRLVAQGVLAPIDIIAASNQVTTFEQNVYTAQELVTTAENTLKTLVLPDRTAPLWSSAITPITPVALDAPRIPLEQAETAALTNRPELAQLQTSADINAIDTRYFKDLTKPKVDLVTTYSAAGLAGSLVSSTQQGSKTATQLLTDRVNQLSLLEGLQALAPASSSSTTVAPNLVGGYGQSLTNILNQTYPTVRVGVSISIPLRNRTAEANLGSSLAQGSRIKTQLEMTRQEIEADVRNSLQSVRSNEARLAAAAASRSSAEQQYASEERMFKAGTSTLFLVLQRQTDLLAARGRELQAQTDLNKAISNLQRATGATLSDNNIAVRTDTPTRELEMRPQSGGSADFGGAALEPLGTVAPLR
jgi:outer membrane protein TolC